MVEKKANMQQQEAALERAEKTRTAAPKRAKVKKFRHSSKTKRIDVI